MGRLQKIKEIKDGMTDREAFVPLLHVFKVALSGIWSISGLGHVDYCLYLPSYVPPSAYYCCCTECCVHLSGGRGGPKTSLTPGTAANGASRRRAGLGRGLTLTSVLLYALLLVASPLFLVPERQLSFLPDSGGLFSVWDVSNIIAYLGTVLT